MESRGTSFRAQKDASSWPWLKLVLIPKLATPAPSRQCNAYWVISGASPGFGIDTGSRNIPLRCDWYKIERGDTAQPDKLGFRAGLSPGCSKGKLR